MGMYYVIIGLTMGASWLVGNMLKRKFKKYSQVSLKSNMTGKEVAEKMLADAGITDVQVMAVPGQLTDHYHPGKKTVNLSEWVHNERTVAAAAVAAHEVGHAVQHAESYRWLGMRSKLVPMVNLGGKLSTFVIFAGVGLMAAQSVLGSSVALFGAALFGLTTLFAFVTLPVEFDASNRAMAYVTSSGIVTSQESVQAKDALKWAAMTYVVAALASLAQLMYWLYVIFGRSR